MADEGKMEHIDKYWTAALNEKRVQEACKQARPNYWVTKTDSLSTRTSVHAATFGTGEEIWTSSIAPAISTAEKEVIIVTCFWARSETQRQLNNALLELSAKALRERRTITVRICFSSCSLFQKIFHTPSLRGQKYSPKKWKSALGLPEPREIAGLDLEVKSIFVLPFSVMHPKFVLIDRKRAFMPSCNISWEDWFEGCLECSGPVVDQFVNFWLQFWANDKDRYATLDDTTPGGESTETQQSPIHSNIRSTFLPSPHHVNPNFNFPWLACKAPPSTPLNIYLLTVVARAEHSIRIQTPNLTSPPVLEAIQAALERGVDVTILTSERLMVLEQLVTAGTTTPRCVKKLVKTHKKLLERQRNVTTTDRELEAGLVAVPVGRLQISYFIPKSNRSTTSRAGDKAVQSHLKLTIVDDKIIVFGSGNLDRASWYTSQELGLALNSTDFTQQVTTSLDEAMEGKRKLFYDSTKP